VLATAAALTREKDPCTLLRAVHRLRQTRDDFVFLHLGAGGDAQAEAQALHRELGLGDDYVFAGFLPGVEDLYRVMDVFVLSSRHEALGTSVLDAFLYGVPVVATNTGGLAQTLAEGRGLLCEVGDDAAMADAMDRLLSDKALRAGMTEKAEDYVRREHDPAIMAARYLEVYEQARLARQGNADA
jgi:glycosyltransferase involved in cell wall biosynthesis